MSWFAQVRHVLWKDVREARWMLAAYVAFVAWLTVNAVFGAPSSGSSPVWMLILPLLGMFLLASVVQADSPTREEAFWAHLPLRATAVAAAKLAMLGILLGVALTGQAIAVGAFGIPALQAGESVLRDALLVGELLMVAIVLAAFVRGLRAFTLLLVAYVVVAAFNGTVIAPRIAAASDRLPLALDLRISNVLGAAGFVLVLLWLYRRRHVRWRAATLVAVISAVGLLSANARGATAAREIGPVLAEQPLVVRRGYPSRYNDRPVLYVPIERVQPDGAEELLSLAATVTIDDDRDTVRLPMIERDVELGARALSVRPARPNVRWLAHGSTWRKDASFAVPMTDRVRAAVAGRRPMRADATMLVVRTSEIAALPLAKGAITAAPGLRVRIADWSVVDGIPRVTVDVTTLTGGGPKAGEEFAWGDRVGMALVNAPRAEGVMLELDESSGEMAALVLPGTRFEHYTFRYAWRPPTRGRDGEAVDASTIDAAWLAGVTVVLVRNEIAGHFRASIPFVADSVP